MQTYGNEPQNKMEDPNDIIKEENEEEEDNKYNIHDFDKRINEEDKSEDESKAKKKNEVVDKDEKEFFERLHKRLGETGKEPTKKEVKFDLNNSYHSNQSGVEYMRRLSVAIPGLLSRKNTLTIKNNFYSKQNTLVPRISRRQSSRVLPEIVRQPTLVKQAEAFRRQNSGLPPEDVKLRADLDKMKEKDKEKEKEAEKRQREMLLQFDNFLDSTPVIVIISIATVFVLLGDDIRILSMPATVDFGFDITKTLCFTLFLLEIIFSCIAKKDYIWSFFFWLDLISTLSLIQEIGFMINPLVHGHDP